MSAASEGHVLRDLGVSQDRSHRYFSLKDLRNISLFGLAYLSAYGYGSLFAHNASSPLWLPDAVLLCALLLVPRQKWLFYLLLAAPIRFTPWFRPPVPAWFIWATFANDAVKAMLAAQLLRLVTPNSARLNTVRKFTSYVCIAILLVPSLSALFGAAARQALGYAFWPSFGQWFLGNALTNTMITPTLLLWFSGGNRQLRARVMEAALWAIGFVFCLYCTVMLVRLNESPIALYAPFPFLVWAAIRLGAIGASSGLSLATLFLMVGISRANGPLTAYPEAQYVHFVQLFLGFMALPVMFVAIIMEERQAVERRLRDSQEELNRNYERIRDLAGRLIHAQEEERKRIARELHDDSGQQIALLIAGLDWLAGTMPEAMAPERSQLSTLKQSAEQVAESLREMSHQLHSSTLRQLGIVRGLEGLCRTFSEQHRVEVNLETEPLRGLNDQVGLCLYRVVQEALNNAVRHGQAKQIKIRLRRETDSLRLEIRDTGIGFNPTAASEGLGLVSIRERLRMVGGTLIIQSSPGQGTVIRALVEAPGAKTGEKIPLSA